jgi:hypothetical protein
MPLGYEMRRTLAAMTLALWASTAQAQPTPCDFKGVSVGDRIGPAEIMNKLGITDYQMNPEININWDNVDRYGIIGEAELREQGMKPFCTEAYCRITRGMFIGDRIPAYAFVSFHDGAVTEIEVSFNSVLYWNDVLPILDEKYGANWKVVEHRDQSIMNYETKKVHTLELVALEQADYGTNRKTGDHCQIHATNLDLIFEHRDLLGRYHAMITIKLVSKNF